MFNKVSKMFFIFVVFLLFNNNLIIADASNESLFNDDSYLIADNNLDMDLKITLKKDGLVSIKEKDQSGEAWSEFIENYKGFIVGFSAFGAVTMVLLFISHFIRLGASAGNPSGRSRALMGILFTGIATALLGSVSLITYITYYALND